MTHLYCDESGTASDQHILVAGVLRTDEPEALVQMIAGAREAHRLWDELHYWKHSRRKLPLYDEVLRRVWEHDAYFEAMVVDKRFVDMTHFGHDKYAMLNAFLVQVLSRCVTAGAPATLHLDHRERLAELARGLLPQLNAVKPGSLEKLEITDSKSEPLIQLCDLLAGVVHTFFEPRPEAQPSRKAAFSRVHFARLLEQEQRGRTRIWRWHPAREDRTPPPT